MDEGLPDHVRERAVELGRRLAAGSVGIRSELEALLADYGYIPRVRDVADDPVLVCYPDDWEVNGVVQIEQIDDIDRAIELDLTGAADELWEHVARENDQVVERVAKEHGPVHAANARAFATFMDNHRARPIRHATDTDVVEFLEEYYPRNAWPSVAEADVVEESVRIVREAAKNALQ